MRFNVIEKEPDCYFSSVRDNLENLLNAVITNEKSGSDFYQPLSEVRENEREYKVSLQLPGMKKEDINIELEDNAITISAENKIEEVQDNEKLHYSQISYGKYQKTFEFANEIDENNTKCEYKDGILNITLKKKIEEKKSSKKLTIQ